MALKVGGNTVWRDLLEWDQKCFPQGNSWMHLRTQDSRTIHLSQSTKTIFSMMTYMTISIILMELKRIFTPITRDKGAMITQRIVSSL